MALGREEGYDHGAINLNGKLAQEEKSRGGRCRRERNKMSREHPGRFYAVVVMISKIPKASQTPAIHSSQRAQWGFLGLIE